MFFLTKYILCAFLMHYYTLVLFIINFRYIVFMHFYHYVLCFTKKTPETCISCHINTYTNLVLHHTALPLLKCSVCVCAIYICTIGDCLKCSIPSLDPENVVWLVNHTISLSATLEHLLISTRRKENHNYYFTSGTHHLSLPTHNYALVKARVKKKSELIESRGLVGVV